MDIEILRRLHKKVNIVLVVGKVDCLTHKELSSLKKHILSDLEEHSIQLYQLPECDSDEDEDFKQQDRELKGSIPFAVVGSNAIIEIAGKKIRGRQYPWGVVDVENPEHSDFIKLRTFLISTHMQDLKDTTQDVHYENFRMQCISQISQHALRERTKLKRESVSSTTEAGITETDRLLLQKDEEVRVDYLRRRLLMINSFVFRFVECKTCCTRCRPSSKLRVLCKRPRVLSTCRNVGVSLVFSSSSNELIRVLL